MKSGHRRTQSWCPHTGECSQVLGLEPTHCQALLHPGVWPQGLSALLVDGPVAWHGWWQDTRCPGACAVLPVCEAGTQPVPGQDLACWWVGWVYRLWWYRCVCLCLVTKSCPALCDPMDCSPPGSSVHGISRAKILEWVAMTFSRDSGIKSGSPALQADSLPAELPGKPPDVLLLISIQWCGGLVLRLEQAHQWVETGMLGLVSAQMVCGAGSWHLWWPGPCLGWAQGVLKQIVCR